MLMTSQQKRIITALVVANIVVILALVTLMQLMDHSATPTPSVPAPWQTGCQWRAIQHLAQAGLGGTVTLASSGALHITLIPPIQEGEPIPVDDAAQYVWTAFDVALALQQQPECADFTQVQVIIQTPARISAIVSSSDLNAYGSGTLSETTFIERVTYQVTTLR